MKRCVADEPKTATGAPRLPPWMTGRSAGDHPGPTGAPEPHLEDLARAPFPTPACARLRVRCTQGKVGPPVDAAGTIEDESQSSISCNALQDKRITLLALTGWRDPLKWFPRILPPTVEKEGRG
jgi:hypothetical protein